MKIVVNRCWGGFGLSHEATMLYAKLSGFKLYAFTEYRDAAGNLDFDRLVEWDGKGEKPSLVHYSKAKSRGGKIANESYFSDRDIPRDDPKLVEVVETLGSKRASSLMGELVVREIPDGTNWEIDDYDGMETIHEVHRSW
jgi:hypothetical protein